MDTLQTLEAFVELHRASRRRALNREDRTRRDDLDEALRDLIDGARPAPKRIPKPSSASKGPAPVAAKGHVRRTDGTASVSRATAPATTAAPTAHAVLEELSVKRKDVAKMNRIDPRETVASAYTRSTRPAFLDAYYEGSVDVVEAAPLEPPRQVVDAEGAPIELTSATRDLWRVGAPVGPPAPAPATSGAPSVDSGAGQPTVGSEPSSAPRPSSPSRPAPPQPLAKSTSIAAPERAPPSGAAASTSEPAPEPKPNLPPAIIHLRQGGTRRGLIERFDKAAGSITLQSKSADSGPVQIALNEVLVIFLGRQPGVPASAKAGAEVEVTLVNERRLVGFSPDYKPNGPSLTVVPKNDRGGVDRVWVPAWAVKAIGVS